MLGCNLGLPWARQVSFPLYLLFPWTLFDFILLLWGHAQWSQGLLCLCFGGPSWKYSVDHMQC